MASFKGQLKLEPRPDLAPLDGVGRGGGGGGGCKKTIFQRASPDHFLWESSRGDKGG